MRGVYIFLGLYGLTLYLLPMAFVHNLFMALGAFITLGLFVAGGFWAEWMIEDWLADREIKGQWPYND